MAKTLFRGPVLQGKFNEAGLTGFNLEDKSANYTVQAADSGKTFTSSTDGVVLLYSSLPDGAAAPYNEGRTATHEVGHYLNLRHIWGDGRCRQDDFVADTPSSDGANYGCPSYPTVNCKSTDMTMNYMDYTDDACMYMFSEGQKSRMRAIFASGGIRESLAQ